MGFALSTVESGLIRGPYPDFGQVHYLVDSDFRTQAQGWTRADRTGPLDLMEARRAAGGVQYVYRTSDYASDAACMQAAIDAMVDFRGDVLFFTPCGLTLSASVNLDVPDARYLSRPVNRPGSHANIVCNTALAISIPAAGDNIEMGFLRLVPNVNSPCMNIDGNADNGYVHHVFVDAAAGATTALTQRCFQMTTGPGILDWNFDAFQYLTSGTQGPFGVIAGTTLMATGLILSNFTHRHVTATLAIGLLDVQCTLATGIYVQGGRGFITGATSQVTTAVKLTDMTSPLTNCIVADFRGSVGYATVSTLYTLAGTTTEAGLSNCNIAIIAGGAGGSNYTG